MVECRSWKVVKFRVYFKGRAVWFAGGSDVGWERQESGKIWGFGSSDWKNGAAIFSKIGRLGNPLRASTGLCISWLMASFSSYFPILCPKRAELMGLAWICA